MKIQYKAFFMALGAAALLSACSTRDVLEDIVTPGQAVPTAYWEVGSTVCKAGESFTFQGKYTVEPGKTPAYSEIWYRVKRSESASATARLAGTSFGFTKTVTATDTMRSMTPIVRFDHTQAEWDGYEFVIKGSVPVSRTLSPVSWVKVTQWDQERFDSYYPAGYQEEFRAECVDLLTKDSTYYNALRTVYINYPFANERFAEMNTKYGLSFPTDVDLSGDDQGAGVKSDLWFSTTEASEDAVVGYYYITIENGNAVVHEIGKDVPTADADGVLTYNGARCYPVYKSSPWVFCRYDDDLGAIVSTVRAAYVPAFRELLQQITFPEWIYDSTEKVYFVEFTRDYKLDTEFRVYDTDGEEGIANDRREISIN